MKKNKIGDIEDRTDYRSPNGIASWWSKDGFWHIALPAPDPNPKTGLRTGGFLWTGDQYKNKLKAVQAINRVADGVD